MLNSLKRAIRIAPALHVTQSVYNARNKSIDYRVDTQIYYIQKMPVSLIRKNHLLKMCNMIDNNTLNTNKIDRSPSP